MRLVVDTNVLISALVRDSAARKLLLHLRAELLTIGLVRDEIERHEKELLAKTRVTREELYRVLDYLLDRLIVLDDRLVESKMPEAKAVMDRIDQNDTPFLAAALATGSAVWSDDGHFEEQHLVRVYKTRDLLKRLEEQG